MPDESATPAPDRSGPTRPFSSRLAAPRSPLGPFAAGAAIVLGAVLLAGIVLPKTPVLTPSDVDQRVAQALASVTPAPATSELVYRAVAPSLVLIETMGPGQTSSDEGGIGSGVVVDLQGDILTSLHVLAGATKIAVTFADGTRSGAAIADQRPDLDIAVLHAGGAPASLQPATLGNSKVEVGSQVFVVGNPFGLDGSITGGIVSGVGRSYREPSTGQVFTGLIQVDAAVNPGSAGGALVDADGEVVGIVSGLINPTNDDVFIGIGLAVPIDVAGGAAGMPPY